MLHTLAPPQHLPVNPKSEQISTLPSTLASITQLIRSGVIFSSPAEFEQYVVKLRNDQLLIKTLLTMSQDGISEMPPWLHGSTRKILYNLLKTRPWLQPVARQTAEAIHKAMPNPPKFNPYKSWIPSVNSSKSSRVISLRELLLIAQFGVMSNAENYQIMAGLPITEEQKELLSNKQHDRVSKVVVIFDVPRYRQGGGGLSYEGDEWLTEEYLRALAPDYREMYESMQKDPIPGDRLVQLSAEYIDVQETLRIGHQLREEGILTQEEYELLKTNLETIEQKWVIPSNRLYGAIQPDLDIGIASDSHGGWTRGEHEFYHQQGRFAEVIEEIAKEIDAPQRSDGFFDLRGVVQRVNGKVKTSHGELRIEKDGIPTIIDDRFQKDHAGRNEFAVYARNEAKAQHELSELRDWKRFAIERGIVTEEDIPNGKLGAKLRDYMNGKDAALSRQELKERQEEIISKVDEFHQRALGVEFQFIIGNEIDRQEFMYSRNADWMRMDLQEFVSLLGRNPTSVEKVGKGLFGYDVYRIRVMPDGGTVILKMDPIKNQVVMLAISGLRTQGPLFLNSRNFDIVPGSVAEEFVEDIVTFLKSPTTEITGNSENVNLPLFFTLINPVISKATLRSWYQSSPILRILIHHLMSQRKKEAKKLSYGLVYGVGKLEKAGAYASFDGIEEIGLGMSYLKNVNHLDKVSFEEQLRGLVIHELAHQVLRNFTDEEIQLLQPHLRPLMNYLRQREIYQEMGERELSEEAIVRVLQGLSEGRDFTFAQDSRGYWYQFPIISPIIGILQQLKLLEDTQTTGETINGLSGQTELQGDMDFVISSEFINEVGRIRRLLNDFREHPENDDLFHELVRRGIGVLPELIGEFGDPALPELVEYRLIQILSEIYKPILSPKIPGIDERDIPLRTILESLEEFLKNMASAGVPLPRMVKLIKEFDAGGMLVISKLRRLASSNGVLDGSNGVFQDEWRALAVIILAHIQIEAVVSLLNPTWWTISRSQSVGESDAIIEEFVPSVIVQVGKPAINMLVRRWLYTTYPQEKSRIEKIWTRMVEEQGIEIASLILKEARTSLLGMSKLHEVEALVKRMIPPTLSESVRLWLWNADSEERTRIERNWTRMAERDSTIPSLILREGYALLRDAREKLEQKIGLKDFNSVSLILDHGRLEVTVERIREIATALHQVVGLPGIEIDYRDTDQAIESML